MCAGKSGCRAATPRYSERECTRGMHARVYAAGRTYCGPPCGAEKERKEIQVVWPTAFDFIGRRCFGYLYICIGAIRELKVSIHICMLENNMM